MRRILDSVVPPSSGQRFPALDGLRGMAVLMVLATHIAGAAGVPGFRSLGRVGVCIFFGLSAYLLYRPWADGRGPATLTYYVRRARRIYPAWIVATIAAAGVASLAGYPPTPRTLFGFLTFTHTIVRGNGWLLPQAWSMGPEVQFYLLLPLLAVIVSRHRALVFIALVAGVLMQFTFPMQSLWRGQWIGFCPAFLCGMIAASGFSLPRWSAIPASAVVLATIVFAETRPELIITNPWVARPFWVACNTAGGVVPSVAVAVLLVVLGRQDTAPVFTWRPLRLVGICGYGIFLLHWPVLVTALLVLPKPFAALVAAPASLLVGFLCYRCVEAPFIAPPAARLLSPVARAAPVTP